MEELKSVVDEYLDHDEDISIECSFENTFGNIFKIERPAVLAWAKKQVRLNKNVLRAHVEDLKDKDQESQVDEDLF